MPSDYAIVQHGLHKSFFTKILRNRIPMTLFLYAFMALPGIKLDPSSFLKYFFIRYTIQK